MYIIDNIPEKMLQYVLIYLSVRLSSSGGRFPGPMGHRQKSVFEEE
jgi:hypothetical protein